MKPYYPAKNPNPLNTIDGEPAVKLYQYQQDYLRGLPARFILAADTGTGKSFMALAHYDKHAYLKPLLILAPASKVDSGDWQRDIELYFAGRLVPEYTVLSYEKFSRIPTVKQFRENRVKSLWRQWLEKYPSGDYAIIADEIHKAKNPQSGIGKALYAVAAKNTFLCGLSGTPLPNGWIDAMNYFKIFGLVKNKSEFMGKYVQMNQHTPFPKIDSYIKIDELTRFWNRIAKPLDKQHALDLPPTTVVPVSLDAGKQYTIVLRDRIFGDRFLDNPSALLHALRQSILEPKVKWLNNFLDEVSDNVVVFYNYREERDLILAMIKKSHKGRKVFRQDGEKHEVPTKENWVALDGARTITLAQYQSGSTGIELTYAATTVYFSPTYSYSNYEQSIGRTNRSGQTRKMTLYLLCAPATIERDVWTALRNKRDFQESQWYSQMVDKSNSNELQLDGLNADTTLGVNDVY